MRYCVIVLAALLFLTACTTTPGASNEPAAVAAAPEKSHPPTKPKPEAAEVAQRPFPDESVYPLLVAEFALRRKDYDKALENYRQQAPILRDSGVSAHTTRLAQFLKRDDVAIEASQLWVELDPQQLEAQLILANLLAREGRTLEALPHMEVIQRAGGKANFSALANGFERLDSEQQQRLLKLVGDLRLQFPNNTQVMICMALLLEEKGEHQHALDELALVFAQNPEQLQAIVLEIKLRQDLKQHDGLYDRIIDQLDAQPGNTRLRMQYARLLTRTDLSEARLQFQVLLDQAPNDPDVLFSMALIQREMGDLEAAKDKLQKLVASGRRSLIWPIPRSTGKPWRSPN